MIGPGEVRQVKIKGVVDSGATRLVLLLEDLDFLVDCAAQKLVPRNPKYVVSEIERAGSVTSP